MNLTVDVQQASRHADVPGAMTLRRWARAAARAAGHDGHGELTVRVVDEPECSELNSTYRGGDGPTNVLSFPFEAALRTDPPLLGDVVVCAPVVAREAREQGKAAQAHFAHMVVHGVLHLLGHRHDEDDEAARMEALERAVLDGMGFADLYAVLERSA